MSKKKKKVGPKIEIFQGKKQCFYPLDLTQGEDVDHFPRPVIVICIKNGFSEGELPLSGKKTLDGGVCEFTPGGQGNGGNPKRKKFLIFLTYLFIGIVFLIWAEAFYGVILPQDVSGNWMGVRAEFFLNWLRSFCRWTFADIV